MLVSSLMSSSCVCVCVCDEEGSFDLSITDSSSKVRNRIDSLVSFLEINTFLEKYTDKN